jgi:hypothetical protein
LPYVDEASVFPRAAPWAAVVFIAAGIVLLVSALIPEADLGGKEA